MCAHFMFQLDDCSPLACSLAWGTGSSTDAGELKQSIDEVLDESGQGSVEQRIQKLLKDNPVMLFMKGAVCCRLVCAQRPLLNLFA